MVVRAEDRDRERRDRERDQPEVRTEREYKEILINVDERETRIAVLKGAFWSHWHQ